MAGAIGGGIAALSLVVVGIVRLLGTSDANAPAPAERGAEIVRSGTRTQKTFSSGVGSPRTTSEWFEHLKEMKSSDNPNRRVLMKHQSQNPEDFLGPDPAAVPVVLDALGDRHLADAARSILKKFESSPEKPYLDDILSGLNHVHVEAQIVCLQMLKFYGEAAAEAVPRLQEMMRSPQKHLAITAAKNLGVLGPSAVQAIGEALTIAEVRQAALESVAGLGPSGVSLLPQVTEALQEDDRYLVITALKALESMGPDAAAALDSLGDLVVRVAAVNRSTNIGILDQALTTYVGIGEPAITPLQELAGHPEERVRAAAVSTLGRIGAPAASALGSLLESDNDELRRLVVVAMGTPEANAEAFVPLLTQALDDSSAEVRNASLIALQAIGPQAGVAVASILQQLQNVDRLNPAVASETLLKLLPGAKPSLPQLIQLLEFCQVHQHVALSLLTVQMLEPLGAPAAEAGPALAALRETIPPVLDSVQRARQEKARCVVLHFVSSSGTPSTVEWRPITAEDIRTTPNLKFLSKEEVIQRQTIRGGKLVGETPPDLSEFDRQIADWQQLEQAIQAAQSKIAPGQATVVVPARVGLMASSPPRERIAPRHADRREPRSLCIARFDMRIMDLWLMDRESQDCVDSPLLS